MKLSIITINYNNLSGLTKTIDSVVHQDYTDYEWIVIDGGSTDGSKELIEKNASQFSYWISEPDNGVYNAMNKGIQRAQGDWLLFLNSGDCLCENNVLAKVFMYPLVGDVIYGNAYYVNPDGTYRIKRDPDKVGPSFFLTQTFCHQACFIRSTMLKKSPYDETFRIAADLAKWIQLMVEGYHFEHLDEFIVNFDTTGIGSLSSDSNREERQYVINKYLPKHILEDARRISTHEEKWKHVTKRKSLSKLTYHFYHFTKIIDGFLCWFEQKQ